MSRFDQSTIINRPLSEMSPVDFAMIESGLSYVELPRPQELYAPNQEIKYCWFIESGIVSIVAASREGNETEVGIVGRDGMIDVATVLGATRSPLRSFIQISGSGYRVAARAVIQARNGSATFRTQLERYAYSYLIQVAHTALANAAFSIEQRLSRWLLMCGDRVGDEEIRLTHEFLSTMLNVRRAGVTEAIQSLERGGFVKASRGALSIINRAALEKHADEAYSPFS